MSFFKSIGEHFTAPKNVRSQSDNISIVGPCIVLDVMLSEKDAIPTIFPYNGPADIGKIRIKKLVVSNSKKPDDEIKLTAYPADRKIISYPLPGELVFVFLATSNEVNDAGKSTRRFFYQTNITLSNSITYNSLPNVGDKTKTKNTAGSDNSTVSNFINNILQRFNKKLKNKSSYIKDNVDSNNVLGVIVKERPLLQPYEGDTVYQGRFGQSIRFGSTTNKTDNPWSTEGLSGAPIIVHRVTDKLDQNNQLSYTTENINDDNSSLYMCSTQKIDLRLSCSTKMDSWRTIYKLKKQTADAVAGANIATNKDETQIYQKVVDVTKPITDAFPSQSQTSETQPTQQQ